MPTSPTTPNSAAAIDRLALRVESPRGAQTSNFNACMQPGLICFEAESAAISLCLTSGPSCVCFEAGQS
jgi:hypothetical protein